MSIRGLINIFPETFVPLVRIPVKWATNSAGKWTTDSASMWAGVGRASRRCKDMMAEVAHISQEKSEFDRHLVSIISSPSSRLPAGFRRDVGHHSGDVGHPRNGGQPSTASCTVAVA